MPKASSRRERVSSDMLQPQQGAELEDEHAGEPGDGGGVEGGKEGPAP